MLPIDFSPHAKKYLKKIKDENLKKLFKEAIELIRDNPSIGEVKIGDLDGIYGYDIRYNNVSYEIAYIIEEGQQGEVLVVVMAGTRENFYDTLKKYMKGK
jgi:mRNA-degrading endonuclease RelE of RelBE toxin-antitoxin system